MSNTTAPRGRGRARGRASLVVPAVTAPSGRARLLSAPTAPPSDIVPATAAVSLTGGSGETSEDCVVRKMNPLVGSGGTTINLRVNYFELSNVEASPLCKHHVDIAPEEDRTFMKKRLLGQHADKFTGFLFDGSTLFTFRNACPDGKPLVLVSKNREGKVYTFTIKFVGTVEPDDFQYTQVYNIIVRKMLDHLKLVEIQRKYYDPEARIPVKTADFNTEIWPGYSTSVLRCDENRIMLMAEIKFKMVRTDTAYDVLQSCTREEGDIKQIFGNAIIGSVVITQYNNRNYRIDDVDFSVTPESTFPQKDKRTKNIVQTKYRTYYRERYNINVRDPNQPMLVCRANARQRRAGEAELLYLVPEFCFMTGLTDRMRANFSFTREVAQHTGVNPANRMARLKNFSKRLNSCTAVRGILDSSKLRLSQDLVEIDGRVLPPQMINFGQNRSCNAGIEADWTRSLRNNTLNPVNIKNWVILYPARMENDVKTFCNTLSQIASNMRYTIVSPHTYALHRDTPGDYTIALDRVINEKNPQIVTCVVSNNQAHRYCAIKKKCIVDKPVPSQVVLYRSITSKSMMSIATKIAIQMNCKVGGAPWSVDIPIAGLMVVGYDVCHIPGDKTRSFSAMVAFLDKTGARVFSKVNRQYAGEEVGLSFGTSLHECVMEGKRVNGELPKTIVITRDGVGEGQLKSVYKLELEAVKQQLEPLYKAEKIPLQLCFVVVGKRIDTKIFKGEQNPPPGTVVDKTVTRVCSNPMIMADFFLISQSVRFGTVNPTHYMIIENSVPILTVDRIQILMYKLTHMYFNWSGTVRVPAPLQYAHKLSLLQAQNVQIPHNNLGRLLYFL